MEPAEPKQEPNQRLECRRCGCRHFFLIDSRKAARNRLRQRKECRHCGRRMTVFEAILA
ncbi:MAG: hypothetical protein ACREP2_13380 [Rhodanobacteraceae bacterium]